MTNHKKDVELLRVTYLRGPNIWTYRPVIETWIDIGELEEHPSNTLPGLYERLTAWLPGLIEHRCGVGERGGFLERLREGTWAAHILEHVVLELQNLAGMQTGFGKARQTSTRGVYKMAFRTRQEQVGRAALEAGRKLLMAAVNDTPFDMAGTIATLREMVDSKCLGPSTAHIVDAASARKIPSTRLTSGNLVQLGYGIRQRRIWTAETDQTSAIAETISRDKDLTKSLLESCGVPVPQGRMVDSPEDAWEAAQDIGLPIAIKPYDGNHGRGVSLNLMTQREVEDAYCLAEQEGNGVIAEQFISGSEHRLLVVGKRVVAAAKGEEAWITGDGECTVVQLIDAQLNSDPRRGSDEEFPLNAIILDEAPEIVLELQRQGYNGQSVPARGKRVLVQRNGNVGFDVTDQVHPSVAGAAVLAARVVGLDIAGVDLVAEDISRPLEDQRGAIIEVNAGPGLLFHLKPAAGQPRPVGQAIVEHLFGSQDDGRVPIVGVIGTADTALIACLVSWLLHINGKYVGLASSDGLFLNGRKVLEGAHVNFEAGERLLINRSVEAAVFENSSRMILAEGLPYDRCQVGIVTDLNGHESLSEFYIGDRDQLFNVVRTQVDVILPSGAAVLNASDPDVVRMAELCDGEVIFYSSDTQAATAAAAGISKSRTVTLQDGHIVLADSNAVAARLPLASFKLAKTVKQESLLAAVAAAWGLHMTPDLIGAGLASFEANPAKTVF